MQGVVFDLDNTLYPESEYFYALFKSYFSDRISDLNKLDFLFNDFDHFRFSQKDIFSFVLHSIGEYSEENHQKLFDLYIQQDTQIFPYKGVNEVFDFLKSKNQRIIILTNGVIKAQENKWRCLQLDKSQIDFYPARIFGADKPQKQVFESLVAKVNISLHQIVWVGDRFENDLAFPHQAGAKTLLIHPYHTSKFTETAKDFAEVLKYFTSLIP